MGKATTYQQIKDYINGNSGNGCELLTTEKEFDELYKNYIPSRIPLRIKCHCTKEFTKDFHAFKDAKQKQCSECGLKLITIKLSKTYEEIKDFIENVRGYKVITSKDEFNKEKIIQHKSSNSVKFTIEDDEGYYYHVTYNHFSDNHPPNRFHAYNMHTIRNIRLWTKLNNKPFELVSNVYENEDIKLKWKCLKSDCGEFFYARWNDIICGVGCGVCSGRQVTLSNCLATKRPDLVQEWHPTLNGELTPYNVTYGSKKEIWWKCKECGHEWIASVNNRNKNNKMGSGCPECNESKGETIIKNVCRLYNIPYDSQYTFDDLIGLGGGLLKFDIPIFWDKEKTKLRMLIEFDGLQHFRWVKSFQTKENHERMKIHDKMKDEYCKKNNIKLLRISYKQINQIEEIILNNIIIK